MRPTLTYLQEPNFRMLSLSTFAQAVFTMAIVHRLEVCLLCSRCMNLRSKENTRGCIVTKSRVSLGCAPELKLFLFSPPSNMSKL